LDTSTWRFSARSVRRPPALGPASLRRSRAPGRRTVMADPSVRVCIDRAIPEVAETELAVTRSKKWPNGQRLRVRFLGGAAGIQARVRHYAEAWHPYANVTFEVVDSGPAEIRVSFVPDGSSWSAVGTDAL